MCIGAYTVFYVTEPKLRKVEAAGYIDRIVHRWCYDNFLEPVFIPQFIRTSYACIKGRGMHVAALDVQKAMRECQKNWNEYYILKMDVSKYFQSIDKDILVNIIKKKIKDEDVLWVLKQVIYSKRKEKGIPIGNLTSQLFANLYYNEVDQFIKHNLKVRYYFRYMDDSIILMQNKEDLKKVYSAIKNFIADNLKLEFNKKTNIFKSKQGVNFCGYYIRENRIKLRQKGKKKLKRKVKVLQNKIRNGEISSERAKVYLCGHFGYVKYANADSLIEKLFFVEPKQVKNA